MAKKEMVISTCDRCDKEVLTEFKSFGKNEAVIPDGWINVQIKSRKTDIIEMDLCDECGIPVLKAAKFKN